MSKKIIVIGAGITGLFTALKLIEQGYHVTVMEQASTFRCEGGGLCLWPTAVKLLENLGINEELHKISGDIEKIKYVSSNSEPLKEIPLSFFDSINGASNKFILRRELQDLLASLVPKSIIYFNKKCIGIKQNAYEAIAEFADGSSASADCIIAADGIFSKVRKSLFPNYQLNYTGIIALVGIVNSTETLPKNQFVFGLNRLSILMPVSKGRYYSFMVRSLDQGLLQTHYNSPEKQLELFEGWSEEVDVIIKHLHESLRDENNKEHYFCQEVYDADIYPKWFEKRVVLVGESVHPISPINGFGTSICLKSAMTLVNQIKENPKDLEFAFEAYQNTQQKRLEPLLALERTEYTNLVNPSKKAFAQRVAFLKNTEPQVLFASLIDAFRL